SSFKRAVMERSVPQECRRVTMARRRREIAVVRSAPVRHSHREKPASRERTMLTRRSIVLTGLAAVAAPRVLRAQAPDKLKVAISQRGFWDSSFLEFAEKEGMLKAANLDVEFFYTEGGGQTLQVLTSGSVDVAMSNGLLGTIGAFSKGVPLRAISAQMTGANELFWYVKSDSKIRSLKDATDSNTIAFSAPGSSSNLILLSLLNQAGSK